MMSGHRVLRRYRVEGRVQGVGFRYFVWREAQRLNVLGWVRNRLDGSVEVLAASSESDHARLVEILQMGPRWSRVDSVSWADEPEDAVLGTAFEIRRDR